MSTNGEIRIEDLFGTWKLVSTHRTIVETGEILDLTVDNSPFGSLMYGNDGRMLVLNLTRGRPKPDSLETISDEQRVQLFRTMVAYGGTYTLDGRSVSHHIDISWNEYWTGTTQVRSVARDGERLVFTTSPAPGALDGKWGTAQTSVGKGEGVSAGLVRLLRLWARDRAVYLIAARSKPSSMGGGPRRNARGAYG